MRFGPPDPRSLRARLLRLALRSQALRAMAVKAQPGSHPVPQLGMGEDDREADQEDQVAGDDVEEVHGLCPCLLLGGRPVTRHSSTPLTFPSARRFSMIFWAMGGGTGS